MAPKKTKTKAEPTKVAEVATQITDLVETAQEAEVLREENQTLTKTLKETARQAKMAKEEATAYAATATAITEQDIQNLLRVRARIEFEVRSTTGLPRITIQGTGRRRVQVAAPSFVEALIALRSQMGKVPE